MTHLVNKTCLVLACFLGTTQAINAQKIDKDNLVGKWHIDKYSDDETYYDIPKKEQGDYFLLRADMTYESQSEGEPEKGTWMLNTNGVYIELKTEDGEVEKMYIMHSTPKTLVVMYDVDEYRSLEAHYVTCL